MNRIIKERQKQLQGHFRSNMTGLLKKKQPMFILLKITAPNDINLDGFAHFDGIDPMMMHTYRTKTNQDD